MTQKILMLSHVVLCAWMIYGCFCRAVLTDANTWLPMRLANVGLAACAACAMFAPIITPGWAPDFFLVLIESGMVAARSASSFYWRRGVPPQYQMRPVAETLDAFRNICADHQIPQQRTGRPL
jgi:hypothetical protein